MASPTAELSGLYKQLLPDTQKSLLEKWSNLRTFDFQPEYNVSAFGNKWETGPSGQASGQTSGTKYGDVWGVSDYLEPSFDAGQETAGYSGGYLTKAAYSWNPIGTRRTVTTAGRQKQLGAGWGSHQAGMSGSSNPWHQALAMMFMSPKGSGGNIFSRPDEVHTKKKRHYGWVDKSRHYRDLTFQPYYQPEQDYQDSNAYSSGEGKFDWGGWGGQQRTWEESALSRYLYENDMDLWNKERARSGTRTGGIQGSEENKFKYSQYHMAGDPWSF